MWGCSVRPSCCASTALCCNGWAGRASRSKRTVQHTSSLTLDAGSRIDLFEYPEGEPRPGAAMHPHIAFMVAPRSYLAWKRRLESEGVITTEIMRPGPPGQASSYFYDPFGNHLEKP
jgi:catechol 2,3-dioxygenase-like lactoylglutathione lyase family enzyme